MKVPHVTVLLAVALLRHIGVRLTIVGAVPAQELAYLAGAFWLISKAGS